MNEYYKTETDSYKLMLCADSTNQWLPTGGKTEGGKEVQGIKSTRYKDVIYSIKITSMIAKWSITYKNNESTLIVYLKQIQHWTSTILQF